MFATAAPDVMAMVVRSAPESSGLLEREGDSITVSAVKVNGLRLRYQSRRRTAPGLVSACLRTGLLPAGGLALRHRRTRAKSPSSLRCSARPNELISLHPD